MKTKLGVVLSGGGAKGAYEAGFLKALSELNIQPDAIAGTSIGALNGAVYSAQKDTNKVSDCLEKIWKDMAQTEALKVDKKKAFISIAEVMTFFSPIAPVSRIAKTATILINGSKSKEGVLTTRPVESILDKYASPKDLINGLPFYIGVTKSNGNLIDSLRLLGLSTSGLTEYININNIKKEDMHKYILASAALPIAFDSMNINNTSYRDGCLGSIENEWGNTPAKPLVEDEKCTHLIICHLNEGSYFNRYDPIFKDTTIIEIRPKNGLFNSSLDPLKFSVERIDEWMEQGYVDAKRILEESFNALKNKYKRILSEQKADIILKEIKSKKFFIPDE